MSLKDVKKSFTDGDIIRFMKHLGSDKKDSTNPNEIIFQTVCHHKRGEKRKYKLYYYKNSQRFFCYTSCGAIGDIFNLAEVALDLDKSEATKYVLKFFDVDYCGLGVIEEEDFGFEEEDDDEVFFQSIKLEDIEVEPLAPIKRQGIMRIFLTYYCREWLKEGITKETMDKYNIKFSPEKFAVIIPHHNIYGEIVGVRVRNLDPYSVENFGKYTPLYMKGKMYNHKLGNNLYGLDKNKEAIKRFKKVVVFEGEKSVLQMDSFYGKNSIAVALCGSNMNMLQKKMLIDLGVEEIIFAFDKQYDTVAEEVKWSKKVYRTAKPLLEYGISVTKIWDNLKGGLLGYKDSPVDKGKQTYDKLVKNRKKIHLEEGDIKL